MDTLTERQLVLLKAAANCIERASEIVSFNDKRMQKFLRYDNVEQDLNCLADDLRIEFGFKYE